MLGNILGKVLLLGMVTALVSCSPTESSLQLEPTIEPALTSEAKGVITLGEVSNKPTKKIKRFGPMADYLAANLSQFGIGVGEVKIAPDLNTITTWLESGEVDIYFDSPYPAMIVSDKSGAEPILRRWKYGQAEYFGVFLAMKKQGITSLSELQGKMIAFEKPISTSGYFLPLVLLRENGLNPVEKSSPDQPVAADEVGYIFSDDDENTIQWVISGRVAAGAADISTFRSIPESSRESITVLAETEKVSRHLVLLREGIEPEKAEAIKNLLLGMDKTPEGKEVLQKFEKTAKFEELPKEVELERMGKLYKLLKER
ncbi:MAG: phosphate/phosphite/phosphonate ABC transporter substrate-binding protein [Symploca sp. SIO1C4]|uniref:Phosphate/phosphite/phosphonate ABC transporter substrate-binding protein n=1 Tax=Symploca sp. SIO1C4 TaxID=2607765 RepID=A0A6B3N3Z4_9CYAN|nr:phosphate/phosphite/phosphonate ABC transporter substrate-binding protein [Symploca sp. SIO1C4]